MKTFSLSTYPSEVQIQTHIDNLVAKWGIDQVLYYANFSGQNHILEAQMANLQLTYGRNKIVTELNRRAVSNVG